MDPQNAQDQGTPMAQPPQSAGLMPTPVSPPPVVVQSQPMPVPTPSAMTEPAPAAGINAPAEAADNDVIEREWITKAKQVIAETRDDPFKQVQQLNRLKAEYMQKRYNKTVKLPDA